ncbi:MAG: hypothetical protein ACT4QD_25695 [Acidobacteriota bacterium]
MARRRCLMLIVMMAMASGLAAQTPQQRPRGQMPDFGRTTKQDDTVPLFDFELYFVGTWTFEWNMPEGPLGPAGPVDGTTVYRALGGGVYEATTQANGPAGTISIKETIRYQKDEKTLTRDVVDSRGFAYSQTGTIGGDLGGFYNIFLESAPFTVMGRQVRLKHGMRLTAPLAHRVSISVAEDGGEYRNYGTPWWNKQDP